jgi:hypothetical protein
MITSKWTGHRLGSNATDAVVEDVGQPDVVGDGAVLVDAHGRPGAGPRRGFRPCGPSAPPYWVCSVPSVVRFQSRLVTLRECGRWCRRLEAVASYQRTAMNLETERLTMRSTEPSTLAQLLLR